MPKFSSSHDSTSSKNLTKEDLVKKYGVLFETIISEFENIGLSYRDIELNIQVIENETKVIRWGDGGLPSMNTGFKVKSTTSLSKLSIDDQLSEYEKRVFATVLGTWRYKKGGYIHLNKKYIHTANREKFISAIKKEKLKEQKITIQIAKEKAQKDAEKQSKLQQTIKIIKENIKLITLSQKSWERYEKADVLPNENNFNQLSGLLKLPDKYNPRVKRTYHTIIDKYRELLYQDTQKTTEQGLIRNIKSPTIFFPDFFLDCLSMTFHIQKYRQYTKQGISYYSFDSYITDNETANIQEAISLMGTCLHRMLLKQLFLNNQNTLNTDIKKLQFSIHSLSKHEYTTRKILSHILNSHTNNITIEMAFIFLCLSLLIQASDLLEYLNTKTIFSHINSRSNSSSLYFLLKEEFSNIIEDSCIPIYNTLNVDYIYNSETNQRASTDAHMYTIFKDMSEKEGWYNFSDELKEKTHEIFKRLNLLPAKEQLFRSIFQKIE